MKQHDFQVLNTTYVYIKCCAVTILHILLYPDFSIFLEETRGALRSDPPQGADMAPSPEDMSRGLLGAESVSELMEEDTERKSASEQVDRLEGR
ncbi:hypothetical protein NQZ68_012936 [Dissostichus eleginoides]|nr:hypothetical protein NQZ68_012936 [Dissostichus eleginoides]